MNPPKPRGKVPAFYKPGAIQPNESVGYLMRRILASVQAAADRELEPTGLTHAQWIPLYKLYLGHASTAAELAAAAELDAGAMTRTLDRLEAKGLVRRVRSEADRRVVNIELTPEGKTAAQAIPQALSNVLNAHLKGFTAEEWQLLKSFLNRMLENGVELQQARNEALDET
ncbi:MarR family winged helix-turn-helix transcriptional regulator [Ramlibacter albus]|uniref:MarR family transcriptional regulator n=1 Tax=Ramlibacter albus TaxID=2079448 RepID=A0A923MFE9_9BURK|nr:MarR family transcriptional regulator [Ramlibacter albus]MBC5768596.1 MarR family transcriptional regulator [Ramlibacter albus]